jgi:pimeloyl-ACP methyl ester carboxylesterase
MPFFRELFYEEPPAGTGKPLLMLHGIGASGYSWRHLRPQIPAGYKPYVIDLKGFGQAGKPDDGKYSIHDQAELVFGLIETLGPAPVSLIGHSMGGGIALMTALRLVDAGRTLDGLILIDAVSYPVPAFKFLANPLVNLAAMLAAPLLPPRLLIRFALKRAYFDPGKVTEDQVEAYAAPLKRKDGRDALRTAASQLFPPDLGTVSGRYPQITARTLLLWGREDTIIPPGDGRRLAGALPNARLVEIERSGHIPQEETPEKTVPEIVAFLQ